MAGEVVWYSHLFQNFLQFIVIHTAKGFDIVNKAEIDDFLELSCFFNNPTDVGSAFFKSAWTDLNLEVQGSCIVEAWLGELWALVY